MPERYGPPEVHVDHVQVEGVAVHRAGLAVRGAEGLEVTGAAADEHDDPTERAGFELLERIATLEAILAGRPELHGVFPGSEGAPFRYARSNGIALHGSYAEACERARLELAERDRVLRSWYGETAPERLALGVSSFRVPANLRARDLYQVEAYAFPDDGRCRASADVEVVGTFAFPRGGALPLAMGFAARRTREDAVRASVREAVQCLAFLWGEPLPEGEPAPGPTALAQLEYWQAPARQPILRGWLAGAHRHLQPAIPEITRLAPEAEPVFHDLTPPWSDGFRVARATCRSSVPLVFGVPPWAGALPDELAVQPVA